MKPKESRCSVKGSTIEKNSGNHDAPGTESVGPIYKPGIGWRLFSRDTHRETKMNNSIILDGFESVTPKFHDMSRYPQDRSRYPTDIDRKSQSCSLERAFHTSRNFTARSSLSCSFLRPTIIQKVARPPSHPRPSIPENSNRIPAQSPTVPAAVGPSNSSSMPAQWCPRHRRRSKRACKTATPATQSSQSTICSKVAPIPLGPGWSGRICGCWSRRGRSASRPRSRSRRGRQSGGLTWRGRRLVCRGSPRRSICGL